MIAKGRDTLIYALLKDRDLQRLLLLPCPNEERQNPIGITGNHTKVAEHMWRCVHKLAGTRLSLLRKDA